MVVRRRVRAVFASLARGDYEAVVPGLYERVHHRFAGEHALGGERHTREGVQLWFERLFRLFALDFTLDRVVVHGPPWDLIVTVEWLAVVTPVHGRPYENRGAHVIRMRRFRVTELYASEDTQAVVAALAALADRGVTEAAAGPIET